MIEIIVGTNRPGSNSRKIASLILGLYKKQGVEAALLDLADLPQEIFLPSSYATKPAAFTKFADRVLAAKGLVIVTPEYNGGIPGVLKYFIDMLPFPESFENKPVAFVGVSAGMWGALRPIEHLQQLFAYRNGHVYPSRVFIPGIHGVLDESGNLKSTEILGRLEAQASGFAKFVAKLG